MPSGSAFTLYQLPMAHVERPEIAARSALSELVYELLDAHADTLELAGDLGEAPAWGQHLDYLRSLQRVGREALARLV